MNARIIASMLMCFTAASIVCAGDSNLQTIEELRQSQATGLTSFPIASADSITLWLQETPKRGRGTKIDQDHWRASWTMKFFQVNEAKNDLGHVLVVSQRGSCLRLVDLRKEDVLLQRGDVIAFPLLPNVK